jgi:glycosyltransferase involved in cell wall biosynthesis
MTNIAFHITDITKVGGTEKVTIEIANLLAKTKRYNVMIIGTMGGNKAFFEVDKNVRIASLYPGGVNVKKHYLGVVRRLRKVCKNNKVDVLVGVDTIQACFDLPALFGAETKYIAWEHFNLHHNLGVKMRDIGRKLAAKRAAAVVVLTDRDREYWASELTPKAEVARIYNPLPAQKNAPKRKLRKGRMVGAGKAAGAGRLISVGRLTDQKGFDMAVKIAKKMLDGGADFTWDIYGDGEDREMLQNMIKKYGLDKKVILRGKSKNVMAEMAASEIFVSTARFEGLGLVIQEAKMCGVPCVAFDCDCGPSEIIQDGENGILVKPFDLSGMADAIVGLLNDPEKMKRFMLNTKNGMSGFWPNLILAEWEELICKITN